jgi:DNA-binding SARP family transcriptional activator
MVALHLQFIGDVAVFRDGETVALPPSRKTRGLLAYLALNNRAFRREQLCELLWEIPDDPRGSLRWSLSKLRRLVDSDDQPRIVADRSRVAFEPAGASIDVTTLHELAAGNPEQLPVDTLEQALDTHRGSFLEGLELPNFHEFYAWHIAERERVSKSQATLLRTVVDKLSPEPERALEYARELAFLCPYEQPVHARVINLLKELGRTAEAEQHYRQGKRLLEEAGIADPAELYRAWRGAPGGVKKPAAPTVKAAAPITLLGREKEVDSLVEEFRNTVREQNARCMLVRGEPGMGKSALVQTAIELAEQAEAYLLHASSYESESIRPFALWIDAFRRAGNERALELLSGDEPRSRDQLFSGLGDIVGELASSKPVIVIFDDLQWCDESSAAALHYIMRMNQHQPLYVLVAARDAELAGNSATQLALRGMRRENMLRGLTLGPLPEPALRELISRNAPEADAGRLSEESNGNPLMAIELARAETEGDSGHSLAELVQERMARLDPEAVDIVHWAAVLAPYIDIKSLERVTGADPLLLDKALEAASQCAILQLSEGGFRFSHDLIGQTIYAAISPARKQVMHRRVAELLEADTAVDLKLAADLAHHAAKSGDAGLAARSIVSAGRLCLRFFAYEDALTLAGAGLVYARQLPDVDRVCTTLDLCEIRLTAAPLDDWEGAAAEYVQLAEQALDHGALPYARLGYQMASYLRWMHGQWSAAHRESLQAELVTRGGSDEDHILGMAETAKCLALLERDLSQADALLMEARSLAERKNVHAAAISAAQGMLRYHENNLDEAEILLQEARTRCKAEGDRINEFQANEYLVMLDLERGSFDTARTRAGDLIQIGEKLRGGSEKPFAHALHALCEYAISGTDPGMEGRLEALKTSDAKHRQAYTLTRTALLDIKQGRYESAVARASEALAYSETLERSSEMMLARVALARAHQALGDEVALAQQVQAIRELDTPTTAAWARESAAPFLDTSAGV